MSFPTDITDVNREIILHLDSKSIINVCISNKELNKLCDDWLWRLKISREFVDLGKGINYRKLYGILEGNDANTLLLNAVRYGFVDLIDVAIDRGADIHVDNNEALITASIIGNLQVVERLLDRGANIHARDEGDPENDFYYNALIAAATGNHIDIVRLLLDRGANIHAQEDEALISAVGVGYLDIVGLLIERGVDVRVNNDDAIKWAALRERPEMVRFLIANGATGLDVAFMQAAAYGSTESMRVLFEHGVNVDVGGHAAIISATRVGYIDTIKFLISNGEDVNVHDGVLLYLAIDSCKLNIVQLLIENGIELDREKIKKIRITDNNKEIINYLLRE